MKLVTAASLSASTSRTRTILRQTCIGLLAKLGAVAATLAAMPLMLKLLGEQKLGVWLVLLSIFQWITMFDLGISAGARNEIARAAAVRDDLRVRQAITTGWLYVCVISITLFAVGTGVLWFTPLVGWLGVRVFNGIDVTVPIWLILGGASITFALSFIQSAYAAMEKASAFSTFSLVVNVGFLLMLVLGSIGEINSMESIAAMYVGAMLFGNLVLIFFFRLYFPLFMPNRNSVNHALRTNIIRFGTRIFILQVTTLIIFTTSRMLTSAWLGPANVVTYDAGLKVFSVVTIAHTLLMTTTWSSFTQAFERNEFVWIRQTLRRLMLFMLPLAGACVVLAVSSPFLVHHWLGDAQVGTAIFYALLAATTILSCWSNIFAFFLNAVGETRIQIKSAIFSAAIYLPTTYFLTLTLDMGLEGIVLGTLVSLVTFSVLGPYAVRKSLQARQSRLP